jgi:WhiB family redox-sensing transcriptional regulator
VTLDLRADWYSDAACVGMDPGIFFPEWTGPEAARRTCSGCPVRSKCLDYAVANRIEHGIWGGLTEDERAAMRRRRRSGAQIDRSGGGPASGSASTGEPAPGVLGTSDGTSAVRANGAAFG